MDIDTISAQVAAGQISPRQAQILATAFRLDPSAVRVPCAGDTCNETVTIGQSVSYVVIQATTGTSGQASYQCDEEQHYGCSPRCAIEAAARCMREHLAPRLTP